MSENQEATFSNILTSYITSDVEVLFINSNRTILCQCICTVQMQYSRGVNSHSEVKPLK